MRIGDRVKTATGLTGIITKIHPRKPHEATSISVLVDEIIIPAHEAVWTMSYAEPITNRLYQNERTGEIISCSVRHINTLIKQGGNWLRVGGKE